MKQADYLNERRALRKREGEVPVGARNAFTDRVRALVDLRGDEVKNALSKKEAVSEFVAALREGVRRRDRTCIIQYSKIMKLAPDVAVSVIHEFIATMGAKDAADLKRKVEIATSAEGVDHPTAIERSTAYLEGILPSFEQYRPTVIKRLGGYLPVDSNSIGTDEHPIPGA